MSSALNTIFNNVKLFVYDFDGVMTNNRFILDNDGNEYVSLNRSDGMAVQMIKSLGINQIILSTEHSKLVKHRASKLSIDCYYGVENKLTKLKDIIKNYDSSPDNVCYIGNDVNDLDAMSYVGLKMSPADAEKSILQICDHIINRNGGAGVIRELYFMITGE